MNRTRAVLVGDALLPIGVIAGAFHGVEDVIDVALELSWGPPTEAGADELALELERHGPSAVPVPTEIASQLGEAELLVVHYCPVSRELLAAAPKLKILATCRMGTENLDLRVARERGLTSVHVVGRTTEAVSDLAIGLLLAEARNIARAHCRVMSGAWDKTFPNSAFTPELEGQTVGLVGIGEIGRAMARKLTGFRVKILAYDPFMSDQLIRERGAEPVSLDRLLQTADFISLHARSMPGNAALLSTREFDLMKPTAILINTARSNLIDSEALYDALRTRKIAGAALDVHDQEPLGPGHPLLHMENVTLTPHLASSTRRCIEKSAEMLAANLGRYMRGGELRDVV